LVLCVLGVLCVLSPLQAQEPEIDPQQAFDQARQKYQAGDFKAVVDLLAPLQPDASSPPPLVSLLGGAYIELGRIPEAQALLDPSAAADTAGPALLFNAARAAFAAKQDEKGETYLERAIAKAPGSLAARALGLRYGRQGKTVEAYKLLEPWAKAHPGDGDVRLAAAFCAIELGRGAEAEALLTGLPQDNPQVQLLRGRLLLSRGDPHGAIALLTPLASAPPKEIDRDLRWVLGEARMEIGEAAAAVALLEGHIGDDPDMALLLAQAYQQTGNPDKVLATLKPFVDRLPDPAAVADVDVARRPAFAAMALEYGRALISIGGNVRWPEAVAVLEKATAFDASNLPAWQILGQALAGAGRRDEAQKVLAKFQELSKAAPSRDPATPPTDDPTGYAVSEAARLAATGEVERALDLLRRERELSPDEPRLLLLEARILLDQKRADEAQKAVAGLDSLASRLIQQGKKDEARDLLRKILALQPDDPAAKASLQSLGG
jgi:predicted Zn-dependent protease